MGEIIEMSEFNKNENKTKTMTVVLVYHVDVKEDTEENMDNEALMKSCGEKAGFYSGAATCDIYIDARTITDRIIFPGK
jgi:hypothetical protein